MRRVSGISTTSACQSAMVCHCRRRDVTLASATRMGQGWGSTSSHRSNRGGKTQHPGGGGRVVPVAQGGWGGEGSNPPHPYTRPPIVRGRKKWGQRGSQACLQVNLQPQSCSAVVRQSDRVPFPRWARRAVEGAA